MILAHKVVVLGGILLGLLSVYPGVSVDFLLIAVLLSPLWLPALAIGGVTMLIFQARSGRVKALKPSLGRSGEDVGVGKPSTSLWQRIILTSSIAVCFVLVLIGIPRRIAFLFSRSEFQRHIATAPASEFEGERLGRYLGVYYVDRYAADPRGGAYFRTHTGADGIGPDTMSYGFAFRPNPEGTPFGKAGYRYSHVVGDWFVFSASDDY